MTEIYKTSLLNQRTAIDYLTEKRNIASYIAELAQPGFLSTMNYAGKTMYDVIIFPVTDCLGKIQLLECRSIINKQYFKIKHSKSRIPIFIDFHKALKAKEHNKPLILVEGIIEALSLLSIDNNLNIVSTLRASASKSQIHYMRYLFKDELLLLFNSDQAGVSNAEKIINFYKVMYGVDISVEEIPNGFNDLNEMLVKDKKLFMRFVSQLRLDYNL